MVLKKKQVKKSLNPCVTTEIIIKKFDVLRGRLLGNRYDFFMISQESTSGIRYDFQESTTKDVKLFGYDFRGHTKVTLVEGIAYGYPYYKGSAIFSLVSFLSTTSEKSFIPYKASVTVQALKVCPVRPRVLSGWRITLLEKLRPADES